MNKRPFLALVFVLAAASAAALNQPQRINFQGKLINPATNNPQTGPVSLTFNIYNVPSGGSSLWTETQNNVPLTNGVFSVEAGTQTALPPDLFLGASVYLGVTVVGDAAGEMVPRQNLVESAFAFSAHQLSDISDVRLVAGLTYSTFTNAGNLAVPAGVSGSSGTFTNGVTSSSGTFFGLVTVGTMTSVTGVNAASGTFTNGVTASSGTFLGTGGSQYSLATSSGLKVNAGTLSVIGSGGITNAYGIQTSTLTLLGRAAPAPSNAAQGGLYFDSTSKKFMVSQDNGSWQILIDTRTETMWLPTMTHPQATATSAMSGAANQVRCVRFYQTENFLVERMGFEVTTSAAGSSGDVGIYDDGTKALIVHTGALATNSIGAKSATGLSGYLSRLTMYRYCFCNTSTAVIARSVNATDVTNTLENLFLASPAEGTNSVNCAAGVLPASLGVITNASIIPILSVMANTSGP